MDQKSTISFAIYGPIERTDLPGLCGRLGRLIETSHAVVLRCDVRCLAPDAVTIDALARLHLAAGRHGSELRVHGASADLQALMAFMGMDAVLSPAKP